MRSTGRSPTVPRPRPAQTHAPRSRRRWAGLGYDAAEVRATLDQLDESAKSARSARSAKSAKSDDSDEAASAEELLRAALRALGAGR